MMLHRLFFRVGSSLPFLWLLLILPSSSAAPGSGNRDAHSSPNEGGIAAPPSAESSASQYLRGGAAADRHRDLQSCPRWCLNHPPYAYCAWADCSNNCPVCDVPQTYPPEGPCYNWCLNHPPDWYCSWPGSCGGCPECLPPTTPAPTTTEPTTIAPTTTAPTTTAPTTTAPTTTEPTTPATPVPTPAPTTPAPVPTPVPTPAPTTQEPAPPPPPDRCQPWCYNNFEPNDYCAGWYWCADCPACASITDPPTSPPAPPPAAMFVDVSSDLFDDPGWYKLGVGGSHRPRNYEYGPAFPDWDGDGYLDYLDNGHNSYFYDEDWNMGLNVEDSTTSSGRKLQNITPFTVNQTDADKYYYDFDQTDGHGMTFADLDRDGNLDLVVTVGGGGSCPQCTRPILDNLLLWGDGTKLTGGRGEAEAAGIAASIRPTRFVYVTDANQDGYLDVINIADVRNDHRLTPTGMLFNQQDRTFKEDPIMREYMTGLIRTDADGDGYAEEYVVFRSSCFIRTDETPEKTAFCQSRPPGTNAIYKYSQTSDEMELISPPYSITAAEALSDSVRARSAVSGDFDYDGLADLAVLNYPNKLVIYYSSLRQPGELPLYNERLGQGGNKVINVPCSWKGLLLRSVDLDMDGVNELVVFCSNVGQVLVYSRVGPRDSPDWILDTNYNLGDLDDASLTAPTEDDLNEACCSGNGPGSAGWTNHCNDWNCGSGRIRQPYLTSAAFIDLDNDGYLDAITSYKIGYQRFFMNTQGNNQARNNFIRIELETTISNDYALGTTLILEATGLNPQLREITTHDHGNDRYGNVDPRIVFGLGSSGEPTKVTARWPSRNEKVYEITPSDAAEHMNNFANPLVLCEGKDVIGPCV